MTKLTLFLERPWTATINHLKTKRAIAHPECCNGSPFLKY